MLDNTESIITSTMEYKRLPPTPQFAEACWDTNVVVGLIRKKLGH